MNNQLKPVISEEKQSIFIKQLRECLPYYLGSKINLEMFGESPLHFKIAVNEIGVKEITGEEHNERILEYLRTSGNFLEDEAAWCMAFGNWCLEKAGIKGTGKANARSALALGSSVLVDPIQNAFMNHFSKEVLKNFNVCKMGDLVILWRESMDSWKGHFGFYVGHTSTHICLLGGNQNNEVCLANYPLSRVLDVRRL